MGDSYSGVFRYLGGGGKGRNESLRIWECVFVSRILKWGKVSSRWSSPASKWVPVYRSVLDRRSVSVTVPDGAPQKDDG